MQCVTLPVLGWCFLGLAHLELQPAADPRAAQRDHYIGIQSRRFVSGRNGLTSDVSLLRLSFSSQNERKISSSNLVLGEAELR